MPVLSHLLDAPRTSSSWAGTHQSRPAGHEIRPAAAARVSAL